MSLIYVLSLEWYGIGRVKKNGRVEKCRVKNLDGGKEWQGTLMER